MGKAVLLIRVDPERNMNRFYSVTIQATLFHKHAVVCGWGRRGTPQARWRILPVENQSAAQALAAKIVQRKIRKGYWILLD